MWHQFWIPILIPTLIIKSNCDVNKTDTDVFIRYGGHAEADYGAEPITAKLTDTATTTVQHTTARIFTEPPTTSKFYEDATESVLFVPNKKPVVRDEEDYDGANLKIKDILMMKTVNDAFNKNFHEEKPIDKPNEDIVFISGKNHDSDKTKTEESARRTDNHFNQIQMAEDFVPRPKLSCDDLDCNNTIHSICGAKVLNNEWRYRLFLNDCYFRKVNCGFKYEVNRYKQVTVDKCKTIGAHYIERPFSFKPKTFVHINKPAELPEINSRRASSSSRRSMTMNYNGQFCSHPCPVSCPDDYDPQCAVSRTGQRRVFVNHCKLDHNSCFYSVVWHKRPLAECVGGKKADMRQNRGFIGWMQRVGIVDNKGRLVLE